MTEPFLGLALGGGGARGGVGRGARGRDAARPAAAPGGGHRRRAGWRGGSGLAFLETKVSKKPKDL